MLALLALSLVANAIDDNEKMRIDGLLARIEASGVTFMRNGSTYDASEAAAHLRMKWEKAGARIRTAEEFIDKLASRSYLSGRPYEVVLPGGRRLEAGPWLSALLAEVDAGRRTAH